MTLIAHVLTSSVASFQILFHGTEKRLKHRINLYSGCKRMPIIRNVRIHIRFPLNGGPNRLAAALSHHSGALDCLRRVLRD